jgi:aspartate/tyrosine/aromatic aminotransferase
VQSLSGTGALRVGAEMLHRIIPKSNVYIPNPTWIVHRNLFGDAGFQVFDYPYWHQGSHGLDFDGWMRTIGEAPRHSIFVVHACAHNPTGVDPTKEQWLLLADAFLQKQHFVFMDIAYQGFATGDLDDDAYSTRLFAAKGLEMFVAQSYSKNLGLYSNFSLIERRASWMPSGRLQSDAASSQFEVAANKDHPQFLLQSAGIWCPNSAENTDQSGVICGMATNQLTVGI